MGLLNVNLFLFNKETRQVLPLSCCVISVGARTACLARDLELLRATAAQTTNASKSNKKTSHVYTLTVPSPTVFVSCTPSSGRDLCGSPWFAGGRQGVRKGRAGMRSPSSARCPWGADPRPPLPGPGLGEAGGAARAALPNLALLCHLVPRVRIARARGQHRTETQLYGPAGITGTSVWVVFGVFLNINSHQYFMCRNGCVTASRRSSGCFMRLIAVGRE